MKHIISLTFSIIFLLFLNACGGGSSSNNVDTPPAENIPPVANAGEDQNVIENNTVTLDGSGSTDTDGLITAYEWKEGDTVLSSAVSFNKSDFSLGMHTITLTVTDDDNATASDTVNITVNATIDDNLTLDDFDDAEPHDPTFGAASDLLHFSGSQNCAECHDGISDTSNNEDVSLVEAWKGTMMANAAIDPLYLAKVASEVQRNPNFKDVIEDKCSRCHMPMANVEAEFAGDPIAMFGDGFLNPQNTYYDAAKDGVSCTLCHQIENTNLGTEAGFSGDFVIDKNTLKPARKIYGPYTDTRQANRMAGAVGFIPVGEVNTTTGENHMTDSKLCASCHNLNTPVIDVQTNTLNGSMFPEQAVYTEWEFSDFNTTESCQECHMPTTDGSVVIATGGSTQNPLSPRSPFLKHKFLGANTYMLDIIKENSIKLGATANTARFEDSISDTRKFLQAAADVNITTINSVNGTLNFSVLVINHSGHKFPTSIPTRRAWLHVKVTNLENKTVFESGAFNNNQIEGVDDTAEYEEHYETIDDPSKVQVYEAIMADTDNIQTYTFMQASKYLKDNRILPKGFKSTTPANAQPYGEALNDNDYIVDHIDFIGGSDTVDYSVSALPDGEYTISVTLKYQTASYGFMQDLYKDINLTEVALMKVLDENAKIHVEDISTDEKSITLP